MREIKFRGKRIDNGERVPETSLIFIKLITDKKGLFKCDCGKETEQWLIYVETGRVKSCGCKRYRDLSNRNTTHGESKTRLYRIWRGLFKRCYNSNSTDYHNYGARGISICDEWHNYETFKSWAETNGYSASLTIDRLNENGNYEPSNCRWATRKQQAEHKRSRASTPPRDSMGRFTKSA